MLTSPNPASTLTLIRRLLPAILALGIPGTAAELLLLGHVDDWKQLIPLVLMGLACLVLLWHAVDRGPRPVLALQVVMILFLVSGGLGILLHYRGNVEFELETSRSSSKHQQTAVRRRLSTAALFEHYSRLSVSTPLGVDPGRGLKTPPHIGVARGLQSL